jgi:lipopolysaccharide export system protein LptA
MPHSCIPLTEPYLSPSLLFFLSFTFFYLAIPSKKSRNTANMSIDDDKRSLDVHDTPIGINDNVDEKKGTAADRADMYRMGKTQEMTARTNTCTPLSWANATSHREIFACCPSSASL